MKINALVETVIPLSEAQKKVVRTFLKERTGSSEFSVKLNESLIGGVRITVGSTQYDASIQGKLNQLKAQ